jgi:predicted dehydrogenase
MRLGIVGTGYIVQMVLPHLSSWGIEVAAICGTPQTADQVNAMADKYGIPERYADYFELVRSDEVDTVYVAVPNFLHFDVTMSALDAGKHVICEKPFASTADEARQLAEHAKKLGLFLWEAVVTTRQPNFRLVRNELLPRIGDVKVVTVNYSQYSSRYDAFRAGEVLPAFDPKKSGGAIMDLGLYTLSYTIGLFGEPSLAEYRPNIDRGIDTSGIIDLDYPGFKAINICAKDCGAPCGVLIEGIDGYIKAETPPNLCGPVTLHLNDGTEETFDRSLPVMWEGEFREFKRQVAEHDLDECYRQLDQSLVVSRIQNEVRVASGVLFPADK